MGASMNRKTVTGSGVSTAMRAVVRKDIFLSLGLAAVIVALTSVIGSI